ncbi:MAG: ROK family transcriptional regulator [Tepidisphaeraceae bacterium]
MSSPTSLRLMNRRRLIEAVLRSGRAPRGELSRVTGISPATVSRIVDELLAEGVLSESASTSPSTGMGRPSTWIELEHQTPRVLAVRLGVSRTRVAQAPLALPSADDWQSTFDTPDSAAQWAAILRKNVKADSTLKAIVLSVPGVVDETGARVLMSPNLRWTEKVDLQSMVSQLAPKCPVMVVQELRALALGHLAMNPQERDFLLIDFGTGVGAAAVANGQLYAGPLPLSGEIGHTPVLGNRRPCGCGSVGCVETLVSRRGLLASCPGRSIEWPELSKRLRDASPPAWLRKSLDAAAVSVASALNVLGLRRVVVTGWPADASPAVVEHLAKSIRSDAMWARFGEVEVVTAPRRRLAGLVSVAIRRLLLTDPVAND